MLPLIARRFVAVVTTTTLVSAGGVAAGVLGGVAEAQTVTSVSPTAVVNNGVKTFTVQGSDFMPVGQESVTLRRHVPLAGQPDIVGTVTDTGDCDSDPFPIPDDACSGPLVFTADMTNVAFGSIGEGSGYDVIVVQNKQSPLATDETDPISNAISVATAAPPTVTGSTQYAGGAQPYNGKLEITGTNLNKGSKVEFLLADGSGNPTSTVDTGLSFTAGIDGADPSTGYVSGTTLRGTYSMPGSFIAGKHFIRVTNAALESGISSTPFYQPRTVSEAPTQLGRGASAVPLVFTGTSYQPGSSLYISGSGGAPAADVTIVGDVVVSNGGATLTVPVTVSGSATTGARSLVIRGAEGAFAPSGTLTITAAPTPTSVSPNSRGQNYTGVVTVAGSGFDDATVFDFGPGITAVTGNVTGNGTSAPVTLTIDADAATGARNVVATNTDHGTATLANGFFVNAKPVITGIDPPSGDPGTSVPVALTGTGFVSGATLTISGTGVTASTPTVQDSSHASSTFTVSGGAATGPRDVTITNPDGGKSTCTGCFGINSLGVSPRDVTNTSTKQIVLTGSGLSMGSVVTVAIPGAPSYQPTLTASNVSFDSSTNKLTVQVPLTYAAADYYTVTATVVSPPPGSPTTLSCTGCLHVITASAPAVTTVAPDKGGQGAVGRVITLTGTGFARGQTVSFGAGITTTSVEFDTAHPDQLKATIDIASAATPGTRDVTVTNIGETTSKGTKAAAFTVTAAPITLSVDPDTIGQGGVVDVTLTGTGYQTGATVSFGDPKVTGVVKPGGTATSLTVTVTVAQDADINKQYDVTVTNLDGGTSTLTEGLVVTPAPIITSIAPNTARPGATLTAVQFVGDNFASETSGEGEAATTTNPTIAIAGVAITNVVVTDDQHLKADLKVNSNAALGTRTVFITNPDGGRSSLANGFRVANPPVAPTNVAVPSAGNGFGNVTWSFPTAAGSDGGSPVTGFIVTDGDSTTHNDVNVGAAARTAKVTGLVNGKTYNFKVYAKNVAGTGTPGTAFGTPYTVPSPPTSVTAKAGDGTAVVTWSGANPRGRAITEYTITAPGSGRPAKVVSGTTTSTTFTGLTNGVAYRFQVKAKNVAGYGTASALSPSATPRWAITIVHTHSPTTVSKGESAVYSGRLYRTRTNVPLGGVQVFFSVTPQGSTTPIRLSVTTNSSGVWGFRRTPPKTETVRANFAGDSDDAPVNAKYYIQYVTA